jgi:putative Mg2+ transporter-C (MgtC) family protein
MSSIWVISHWDLILRLLIATVLGGLVGLEREWSNHAAGFRTHILVCIGSATIMLLSIYGFSEFASEPNVRMDPARLAAQVISGIGFLGAGAILRNGSKVSGLTTAASLWVVAAIGLCTGAGFFFGAAVATVFVLLSLFVLNKWERHLMRHRRNQDMVIRIYDLPGSLGRISTKFGEQGIQITKLRMQPEESMDHAGKQVSVMELRIRIQQASQEQILAAIEAISSINDVVSVEFNNLVQLGKGSNPKSKDYGNHINL